MPYPVVWLKLSFSRDWYTGDQPYHSQVNVDAFVHRRKGLPKNHWSSAHILLFCFVMIVLLISIKYPCQMVTPCLACWFLNPRRFNDQGVAIHDSSVEHLLSIWGSRTSKSCKVQCWKNRTLKVFQLGNERNGKKGHFSIHPWFVHSSVLPNGDIVPYRGYWLMIILQHGVAPKLFQIFSPSCHLIYTFSKLFLL